MDASPDRTRSTMSYHRAGKKHGRDGSIYLDSIGLQSRNASRDGVVARIERLLNTLLNQHSIFWCILKKITILSAK